MTLVGHDDGRSRASEASTRAKKPAETTRRVIIVGSTSSQDLGLDRIAGLDATPELVGWHQPVTERVTDDVACIVLAGDPPTADLSRHLRTLAELFAADRRPLPPVIILEDVGDARARELYEAGAALVAPLTSRPSQGPGLAEIQRGLIPRVLAARLVEGPAASVDDELARQARIRLSLASPRYARLDVAVVDGVATVRGALGVLWRRVHVERLLTLTPGLDEVFVEDVRIDAHAPGESLANTLARTIDAELGDHPTVTWSVVGGIVVFAGSVSSRADLERLIAATRRMRGVRGIQNNLVVSPSQTERDGEVARQIVQRLDTLGVDVDVDAGVVGQFAVLRGSVEDEGRKRLVERAARDVTGIDHVVDELEIAP